MTDTIKCPSCSRYITPDSIKCIYCGKFLNSNKNDVSDIQAQDESEEKRDSCAMESFMRDYLETDGSISIINSAIKRVLCELYMFQFESPKWLDTQSFEHVQTTYVAIRDYLDIKAIFRCTDNKGEIETYEATAKIILKGYTLNGITKPTAKDIIIRNSNNQILLGTPEEKPRINKGYFIVAAMFFAFLFLFFILPKSCSDNSTPSKSVEKIFSQWDGSLPALNTLIKNSMNDPSSFVHVQTAYSDEGGYLIVKTTYRGKNAFGGIVTNSVTAKVNKSGSVIEVLSQ